MRYAMVIVKSDEEWEAIEAERDFDTLIRWRTDLRARGKIIASAQLGPPRTATTVSWRGPSPTGV